MYPIFLDRTTHELPPSPVYYGSLEKSEFKAKGEERMTWWTLQVRFLVKADEEPEAWKALHERLPKEDEVLITYASMFPAEEVLYPQSSEPRVSE